MFDERRKYQAEIERTADERRKCRLEMDKITDERLKMQQERQLAPWQIAFGGLTAGVALFAAVVAFVKYLL